MNPALQITWLLLSALFPFQGLHAQAKGGVKSTYEAVQETVLPPLQQRTVIGTWLIPSTSRICTRSFEQVRGRTYMVRRCEDGTGGKAGQAMVQANTNRFSLRNSGIDSVFFEVLENGDLSVRDKSGQATLEKWHPYFWPTLKKEPERESARTSGSNCFKLGYRYGRTATTAMKGGSTDPSDDFVMPDRCKDDPEMSRGVGAGTSSAR